ncbi:MAG TPA: hypothetical protein VFC29_08500 [Candidatus Limnocylindrales bacterium]|nr:hypothetical protein [Candidatus Limnocylindrales bacterium]
MLQRLSRSSAWDRLFSATWLMQEGKDVWTTAGFLGTSVQMLEQTYAKHHPNYQAAVLDAFASPDKKPGQ